MHTLLSRFCLTLTVLFVPFMGGFAQDSLNVRRLSQIYDSYGNFASDVATTGSRAYICSWGEGLATVDISDPDTLTNLRRFFPPC